MYLLRFEIRAIEARDGDLSVYAHLRSPGAEITPVDDPRSEEARELDEHLGVATPTGDPVDAAYVDGYAVEQLSGGQAPHLQHVLDIRQIVHQKLVTVDSTSVF